ncbi:hypothetical protein Slin_0862 [Spirosoma linguale DSM 74]|uniref:Uncharacterized protein n=2 Tax=Spirosoma TaxID=107 RepID=D2QI31_SPILD|nr:hypothetical protein Slin_0862 [Spirosoma linguale DSM 74]
MWLLTLLYSISYSQCRVWQDESRRIITSCQGDKPTKSSFLLNRLDRGQAPGELVYLGNPFLTYPIYQEGTLELTPNQPVIHCQLAFNLVDHQVRCLLPGDSIERAVFPDAFTVNGRRFIARAGSIGHRSYDEVLYTGKSKVLVRHRATLTVFHKEPYQFDEPFDGAYTQNKRYFIELEGQPMQEVDLFKKSVLKILGKASKLNGSGKLSNKLTPTELIGAVASYDGFR